LQAFEKSISVPMTDWPKEIGEIPGRKIFSDHKTGNFFSNNRDSDALLAHMK
jgi:hypothetical protein